MTNVVAAIDIGSGSTKLLVLKRQSKAKSDASNLSTAAKHANESIEGEEILFDEQVEVLLGEDVKKSADGALSAAARQKSRDAVANYVKKARELGAQEIRCIATAVFRTARNGQKHLDRMNSENDIDIRVISQAAEARCGFQTALAVSRTAAAAARGVLVWDSGGASFQITMPECDFKGQWGSSVVTHAMVATVQGKNFAETQTANPATLDDVRATQRLIISDISAAPPPPRAQLQQVSKVIAIGGETSMFANVALAVVGSLKEPCTFNKRTVWQALERFTKKTDDELRAAGFDAQIGMVVPKLTLCHAVLENFDGFGVPHIDYVPANGLCRGVASFTHEQWQQILHIK